MEAINLLLFFNEQFYFIFWKTFKAYYFLETFFCISLSETYFILRDSVTGQ